MPRVRIVEQDDARFCHQPFGDDDFLLVATGERRHRPIDAVRANLQELDHLIDGLRFGLAIDDAEPGEPVDGRERQVFAHRHRQHQSFVLAILRDERHADVGRFGALGAGDVDRPSVDLDRAGGPDQDAEQSEEELALPLAVETAEADHLARPHFQIDPVQLPRPGKIADLDRRRTLRRLFAHRRKGVLVFAPDHHLDDGVVALGASGERFDVAAVAEDGAVVGEFGDFVHAVRDIDDRHAFGAELLEHREHLEHIGARERGRGFVENEHPGLTGQSLRDLDNLPARQRKVSDQRQGMDAFRADAGQQFLGNGPLGGIVDEAASHRGIGDANVVRNRQVGQKRQFLEYAGDADCIGRGRIGKTDRPAVEFDGARIRLDDAGHDLDQCRFAGAVLAQHRVNAPGVALKADILKSPDAAVVLGYPHHAQKGRISSVHSPPPDQRKKRHGQDTPVALA